MNLLQATNIADSATIRSELWRDQLFLLAVFGGPLVWLTLYLWTSPVLVPGQFWSSPLTVTLAVIAYPVVEEWLFRGQIQGALLAGRVGRYRWAGISAANTATTFLFAALHLINHPPLWAAMVLLPSLLFGLFRDRYGRIGPSILLHAFYNAGYFSLWPPL